MKQRGFGQSIYAASAEKKERLGTVRIDSLGNLWRYARAGAAALNPGYLAMGEAIAAAHQNEAILAAVPVKTQALTLTVTAGTVIDTNELDGGLFMINDGTAQGTAYEITGNSALAVGGTEVSISLARGITEALDTTSEFTLVRSPFWGAIEDKDDLTLPMVGVTPIEVPATYYYWTQRRGLACVLGDSTGATIGQPVIQSNATAGSVEVCAAVTGGQVVGYLKYGTVSTEHSPIWLTIE